jgi:hypothetical protein
MTVEAVAVAIMAPSGDSRDLAGRDRRHQATNGASNLRRPPETSYDTILPADYECGANS